MGPVTVQAKSTGRRPDESMLGGLDGLQAQYGQHAALCALAQAALGGSTFLDVVQFACDIAVSNLPVEFAEYLDSSPVGGSYLVAAGRGWNRGHVGKTLLNHVDAHQTSFADQTLLENSPNRFQDLRRVTRFRPPSYLVGHRVLSGLMVRVSGPSQNQGLLGIYSTKPHVFTPPELGFARSLAELLGMALEASLTGSSVGAIRSSFQPPTRGEARNPRQDVMARCPGGVGSLGDMARQSLILHSVPVALYTAWSNGMSSTSWVSHGIEGMTGFPAQTFVDDPHFWGSRVHPDDRTGYLGAHCDDRSAGLVCSEYRWCHSDGEYRWILDRSCAVDRPDGITKDWAGLWLDVTDARNREAGVTASRDQARSLTGHVQAALEDERRRVARELHDDLGHALTALKMDAVWLQSQVPGNSRRLRNRAKAMATLIDETVLQVRRIATALRPALLDDVGIVAAIEWEARNFQRRTGILCRFSSELQEVALDGPRSVATFRILQECLDNVLRHAGAKLVILTLRVERDRFVLEVRDSGRGIGAAELEDPAALGILGMRERARLVGGELKIEGTRGKGTLVSLRVPLDIE